MSYQYYRRNNYSAVDGRVYCVEPQMAEPAKPLHPNDIANLKKEDQMSMVEIYAMELFLLDGKSPGRIKAVPRKERDRIVAEYSLSYDASSHRLVGSYDGVWAILQAKFPETTSAYRNYKECQYAVRYGAQPCAWDSAK